MNFSGYWIWAVVAIVLIVKLWSVFGQRNDEDTQRPNPFATPAPGARSEDGMLAPGRDQRDNIVPPPYIPLITAPASLAGGLERVRRVDPSFDEKEFLKGARTAFTTIINAFAKDDLSPVRNLLGPAVLPRFEAAIEARKKAGETLDTRIARIRDAETTAADAVKGEARITVKFESEQENILRDASNAVVSGEPGRTELITDIWTFARTGKASSPDWMLVETRS